MCMHSREAYLFPRRVEKGKHNTDFEFLRYNQ